MFFVLQSSVPFGFFLHQISLVYYHVILRYAKHPLTESRYEVRQTLRWEEDCGESSRSRDVRTRLRKRMRPFKVSLKDTGIATKVGNRHKRGDRGHGKIAVGQDRRTISSVSRSFFVLLDLCRSCAGGRAREFVWILAKDLSSTQARRGKGGKEWGVRHWGWYLGCR